MVQIRVLKYISVLSKVIVLFAIICLSCTKEKTDQSFPFDRCGDVDCFPGECIFENDRAVCVSTESPDEENISETDLLDISDKDSDIPIEQDLVEVEIDIPQECEPQNDPLLLPGEIRLTTDEDIIDMSFVNYDIHENTVVFGDKDWKIHICNLPCGACMIKEFPDSELDCVYPTVYKDKVACNTRRPNRTPPYDKELLLYNIKSQEIQYFVPVDNYLDMFGDWIVWDGSLPDIRYYNILTGESGGVPSDSYYTSDYSPRISHERIVFTRSHSSEFTHIFVHDVVENASYNLNEGSLEFNITPDSSQDWVIWIADAWLPNLNADGKSNLTAYNLETKEKVIIDPQPHEKTFPSIDGSRVVWTDFRNGGRDSFGYYFNSDIWLYDLERREARPIAETDLLQLKPRISGRWVLYLDTRWRSPKDDLVVFDLCTLDWYESDPMCVGSSKKRQNH